MYWLYLNPLFNVYINTCKYCQILSILLELYKLMYIIGVFLVMQSCNPAGASCLIKHLLIKKNESTLIPAVLGASVDTYLWRGRGPYKFSFYTGCYTTFYTGCVMSRWKKAAYLHRKRRL